MTTYTTEKIAALIGSRICHDLISPVGAVNNGLELLGLSGVKQGPEMDLLADSAASASARIELFRLAFGMASSEQKMHKDQICKTWSNAMQDRRIALTWNGPDHIDRPMAQILLNAALCAEKALPQGGTIEFLDDKGIWTVTLTGPAISVNEALWNSLSASGTPADIAPSEVQFLLLPRYLEATGRNCTIETTDKVVALHF